MIEVGDCVSGLPWLPISGEIIVVPKKCPYPGVTRFGVANDPDNFHYGPLFSVSVRERELA